MNVLKEVKTIVRTDAVERLVDALSDVGVTRFWVSRIHSLGAGVDPEDFRLSLSEGGSYSEKAKVEFVVPADDVEAALVVIRDQAGTGHRGDGVVVVTDVDSVVNVRTGDRGQLALL